MSTELEEEALLEDWSVGRLPCNQSVRGLEEFPDTHNCVIAFSLLDESWTPYHSTVYGYIHPLVVAATMVTNCLVCAVLLRRTMRSPTSVLLVAMAVSDAMTGLLPTPYFIYFYAFGLYRDWVPYDWCLLYLYFTDHLPTIFHTASVWLTVALAAQRYIHVCHGGTAKRLCTVRNMLRVIAIVYAAAILSQLPRLLEMRIGDVRVTSLVDPELEVNGCNVDYVPVVLNHMKLYFSLYFWARVILTHLIPCSALVALNAALARTMSEARRRRNQLLIRRGNDRECRRIDDSIATTLMLVAVVGLLLLVELPLACFLNPADPGKHLELPADAGRHSQYGVTVHQPVHRPQLSSQFLHLLRHESAVPHDVCCHVPLGWHHQQHNTASHDYHTASTSATNR